MAEITDEDMQLLLQLKARKAAVLPERSIGERLTRQLGLTARNVATGAMALPGMVGDAANAAINLPIRGVNALTGAGIPEFGSASQSIQAGIDATGLPQPENATERMVGRVVQDVTGAMVPAGAAARLPGQVAQAVAARPGLQLTGAVGSGLGAGGAREVMPDSPTAEVVGSLGGGAAGLAAHGGANLTAAIGRALINPLYASGRERIVGDALTRMAQNPRGLADSLTRNPTEIVPGSPRSTAEVSGDVGLMQGERAVRSMDPRAGAEFALRDAQRNAARGTAMERMAPGGGMDLQEGGNVLRERLAVQHRNSRQQVRAAYQGVDADGSAVFSGQPIYDRAAPIVAEMYGRSTKGTPPELADIVQRFRAERLSFGDLQAVDRELGSIAGQASVKGDNTLAATAGRLRETITAALDDPASGFRADQRVRYLVAKTLRSNQGATFEEGAVGRATDMNQFGRYTMPAERVPGTVMSGPTAIRQLEAAVLGDPRARVAAQRSFVTMMRDSIQNATPDAAGQLTDSAAKFHRFLADNGDTARILFGRDGSQTLGRIARDFTSRQMVDNAGRAAGSNTFQNLSTAGLLSAVSGGTVNPTNALASNLARPLQWLYGLGTETMIRELMTEAMLNPALARQLAARATPANVAMTARMLEQSFGQRLTDLARRRAASGVPTLTNATAQTQATAP